MEISLNVCFRSLNLEVPDDYAFTLILAPQEAGEYEEVKLRILGEGCDKTIRCSLEELYAALSAAMVLRRQAQATKANEARRWNAWP